MATDDGARAVELRAMKRRATGLLLGVTAAFLVIAAWGPDGAWAGFAVAAAEGSMVGGLADWFAVTALFRHPLGLPIPHTAIIRRRKEQFGQTLGGFVQENFLRPEIAAERIRSAQVPERAATWLSEPANARRVARSVVGTAVAVVDLVGQEDVHRLLSDEITRALRSVPVSRIAGRALRVAVEEGRHRTLVDAAVEAAAAFLDDQRDPLMRRFGEASPWWLPGAVESRLFNRILDGLRLFLGSVAQDPDHEIRATVDLRLRSLADRLEHDPATGARVQEMVAGLLSHPDVGGWTRSLWSDVNEALHQQAGDDRSEVVGRVAEAVAAVGQRLARDRPLQERLAAAAESAVSYVLSNHQGEVSSMISATIHRWDAAETSTKLELLLGRDLQFIRINGTVVGGVAGLAIHAVAVAIG